MKRNICKAIALVLVLGLCAGLLTVLITEKTANANETSAAEEILPAQEEAPAGSVPDYAGPEAAAEENAAEATGDDLLIGQVPQEVLPIAADTPEEEKTENPAAAEPAVTEEPQDTSGMLPAADPVNTEPVQDSGFNEEAPLAAEENSGDEESAGFQDEEMPEDPDASLFDGPVEEDDSEPGDSISEERPGDSEEDSSGDSADDENTDHAAGENVTWSIEDDVLIISGTGAMYDWEGESSIPYARPLFGASYSSVEIEEGVTHIGKNTFARDDVFDFITIPASVTSIGDSAFPGELITIWNINYSGTMQQWAAVQIGTDNSLLKNRIIHCSDGDYINPSAGENVLWSLENGTITFSGTGAMEDNADNDTPLYNQEFMWDIRIAVIEEGITSIGSRAFYACRMLAEATIPASVVRIGASAFEYCASLSTVNYAGTVAQWKNVIIDSGNVILTNQVIHCSDGDYVSPYAGENVTWSLSGGILTISGTGAMYGYNVGTTPWARYAEEITGIVVENGVTEIGRWAFAELINVISISLPASVASIQNNAFVNTAVTAIEIPGNIASIGSNILDGCRNLKVINYTGTVENWKALLNDGLESPNPYLLDAPVYCSDGIYFDNSCGENLTWKLEDGVLTISGTGDMYNYQDSTPWRRYAPEITGIVLEEGVTSVAPWAFNLCSMAKEVSIPSTVEEIGSYAFRWCSSLPEITLPADVVIEASAFYECSALADVYYPGTREEWEALSIGSNNDSLKNAAIHCTDGTFCEGVCGENLTWTLQEGVLTISGTGDMYNTRVYGYTNAPWSASAASIKEVYIEEGVTSLGIMAFAGCSQLTEIKIPASVTTLSGRVFYGCAGLTSIVIPDTVTSLGYYLFQDCVHLQSVKFPQGMTRIPSAMFYGCTGLTAIEIPAGVTAIDEDAFYGCASLSALVLPEGLQSIGMQAFCDCTSLTSVTLPEGLVNIDYYAFKGCSRLSSINLPASLQRLSSAFTDCSSLRTISIPDLITAVVYYTFQNCFSLLRVDLPQGLATVANAAFEGCGNLQSVYYGGTEEEKGNINISSMGNEPLEQAEWFYSYKGTQQQQSEDVVVSYETGTVEDGAVLQVEEVKKEETVQIDGRKLAPGAYQLYDISFVKNGVVVQPNGKVQIKIPIPPGMNALLCLLFRQEEDFGWTELLSWIEGNFLVTETDHCSNYLICEKNAVFGDVDGSGTADENDALLIRKYEVGLLTKDDLDLSVADVSGDSRYTSLDAALILRKKAGLLEKFPTEE